ncbi:cell cycle progression protein 1 isoform X2 [Antennarius striatus]|uniref:cell cycle progression protein 1 isoform X2 n=1 Tax=Antennarius striatus TaxID=241820 RepID=UPI0035B2566A
MTEMSETSSDTESSCGWTILSNESSDIETLGLEAAAEYGGELLERPPPEKTKLQDTQASGPAADCLVESVDDLLEGEQIVDEVPFASEARGNAAEKQPLPLLSASEHSDIVSLGEVKEEEQYELQAETSRMFYLGTPCSSQYTFTAAEPGLVFNDWKLPQSLLNLGCHLRNRLTGERSFKAVPVPQPPETDSSSNEDEETPSSSAAVRRRRFRKNTTSVMPEPEEEESGQSEEWKEKEDEGLQAEVGATDDLGNQTGRGEGGSVLNKCILFALVVAISMAFGHFHGTVQIQERQRTLETIRLNELDGVRNLLYQHVDEQPFKKQLQHGDFDLDDDMIVYLLTELIKKLTKENQELNVQQARIKTQRDELEVLLNQKAEEGAHVVTQQQSLTDENQLLKSSLEKEEKSASILQEELRNLRSKVKEREEMEPGIYSLLVENQQLKVQLEENKQVIQSFHIQKEDVMAEAQTLREKLDTEVKLTDELRREISFLSKKEENSEPEELQSQLTELERRLNMEQQRSDMWERLYVETKEERAKGDTESKVKNTKPGVAGKMKETFDAVKNSTKDFVHHHKEQIKKAKEAVKENLRKFSDSVKSTFRNFKDSASTFINNARGFYDKRSDEKHRSHKSTHKHSHQFDDPFQSDHNTRKSGGKVHEDRSDKTHKSSLRGCSEVFDCAHQESVTIFNKATDPIRADEFYQLLRSYLQQEVDYFHHWEDLEAFINSFFHNGVFIHDRMLFTDFVSSVEDYLADMQEYQGLNEDVFGDLDDYVYRHFFGDAFTKYYGPHRPFERPDTDIKDSKAKQRRRKQQKARSQPHSERKWRRSERNADRHMADVKIELGPMPFDPKY